MQFWKYHGAGNDFILLDQREKKWINRADTDLVAKLCDRHFGIGADGLIILQEFPNYDFEMIYFNADGRESSMCGNGGRCIAAFARYRQIVRDRYRFLAIDGEHEAVLAPSPEPDSEWVELKMKDVDRLDPVLTPGLAGRAVPDAQNAFILNTGSPHYVRFVPSIDQLDMIQEGRAVRYSDRFRAEGINVNMVQADLNHLLVRTYERGVEAETLACGTGVTAAALAHHHYSGGGIGPSELLVKAIGGELKVRFIAEGGGRFTDIWLCGPAKQVFSGEADPRKF